MQVRTAKPCRDALQFEAGVPHSPSASVNSGRVWGRSATELAAGLRAREFSAREVMEAHLERIAAVNPRVNAIVTLLEPEAALALAEAADQVEPRGVLHGLPIAVKDLEDTAGMRTTYGSPLFAEHVPESDSLIVERLRAAGAIVIGKTNTPEFGAGSQTFNAVFGATRNPYDLSRTPGGSSGGAAAAVAAGMLPFADGSDLGASVRNPAAFCNLVGLRPAPGRIPDHGPGDPWNPLPVLGPIGRTVPDVALLLQALAGPDPRDPLSLSEPFVPELGGDVRGLRIAWSRDLGGLPVDPAVTAVLDARRATLEDLGCVVEDAEPDFDGADEAFEVLRGVMFAGAFKEILQQVKPTLAENVRFGLSLTPERIARALELRGAQFTRMREFLTRYDALAAPVTQVPPFSVDDEYPREIAGVAMGSYLEWMRSCSRITVTSHPAVAVPAGFTNDGLPIGLQLVGRARGEVGAPAPRAGVRRRDRARLPPPRPLMPWPITPPTAAHRAAYRDAEPRSFWLGGPHEATPTLQGVTDADLCIVGGGFTGLWAALYAKAGDPGRDGLRFTHRWGGAIDTSSRFSVFFGTAYGGRVAYATGYTGLGVGAARFGGRTALDLLDGRETEATRLRYVGSKPVPFPPEPLRWAVIQYTRNRLAAADRNDGRRGPWLRLLDRLGLGFDS